MKLFLHILLLFLSLLAHAQTAEEYAMKSAFMVKLPYFINWPKNAELNKQTSHFNLCVEGSSQKFSSLEEWAIDGKIKNKPVKINYIDISQISLNNCHLLFITNTTHLNNYLKLSQEKGILTISDKPGNAAKGVLINFTMINESLRFEINLNKAKSNGFNINPRLLKLAIIVNSDGK
ncbi:MAG: YfiR family protein [Gammaproteobacteria bacterium]|nr:YfiR family protein [Gammaproteobacteria bacterium]